MEQDKRNVIDYYKYWETDAIKADLDTRRLNYGILCCNIHGDFNVGSVIRCANAFLAKEVLIYGKKNFDRRGAVGTQNYTNFKHVKEIDELPQVPIIAIDNVGNSVDIKGYNFPDTYFLLAFGEENVGLPQELLDIAAATLYIKQYGSVRSLNVGCASAIAMYETVNCLLGDKMEEQEKEQKKDGFSMSIEFSTRPYDYVDIVYLSVIIGLVWYIYWK